MARCCARSRPSTTCFRRVIKAFLSNKISGRFTLAFVILHARSNKLEDLLPLVPDLLAALERISSGGYRPGDLYEIAAK